MSEEHDPVVTVSVLKSELAVLKSELNSELAVLKSELNSDLVVLKSELNSELTDLKSELNSELTDLKSELTLALSDLEDRLEKRLEKRIAEEGTLTRAHFDIMVEKVHDSVRLVAEVSAHHAAILDNHEARLQKVEKHS
jgi:hypothetical protein